MSNLTIFLNALERLNQNQGIFQRFEEDTQPSRLFRQKNILIQFDKTGMELIPLVAFTVCTQSFHTKRHLNAERVLNSRYLSSY